MSHFLGFAEDNGKGDYYEEPDLNNPDTPNPDAPIPDYWWGYEDRPNPDYWWRYEEDLRSELPGSNAPGTSTSSTSAAVTSASTPKDEGTTAYLAFLEKNKHLLEKNSPKAAETTSSAQLGGKFMSALKSPTGMVLVVSLLGYGAYIALSSKRKKHV